jgi:hypothetical protein
MSNLVTPSLRTTIVDGSEVAPYTAVKKPTLTSTSIEEVKIKAVRVLENWHVSESLSMVTWSGSK